VIFSDCSGKSFRTCT